eukprot:15452563-Alexandrium_andersonii.AAC.1
MLDSADKRWTSAARRLRRRLAACKHGRCQVLSGAFRRLCFAEQRLRLGRRLRHNAKCTTGV